MKKNKILISFLSVFAVLGAVGTSAYFYNKSTNTVINSSSKNELKSDVEELKLQINLINSTLNSIDYVDYETLNKQLEDLNVLLGRYDLKDSTLTDDLVELSEKLDGVNFESFASKTEVSEVLSNFNNYVSVATYNAKITEINNQINAINTTLDNQDYNSLVNQINDLNTALSEFDLKNTSVTNNLNSLLERFNAIDFSSYASKTEVSDVLSNFNNYVTVSTYNAKIQELESDISSLGSNITLLSSRVDNINLSSLQEDITAIQNLLSQYELKTINDNVDSLLSDMATIKSQISTLTTKVATIYSNYAKKTEVDALYDEIYNSGVINLNSINSHIKSIDTILDNYEARITALEEQISNIDNTFYRMIWTYDPSSVFYDIQKKDINYTCINVAEDNDGKSYLNFDCSHKGYYRIKLDFLKDTYCEDYYVKFSFGKVNLKMKNGDFCNGKYISMKDHEQFFNHNDTEEYNLFGQYVQNYSFGSNVDSFINLIKFDSTKYNLPLQIPIEFYNDGSTIRLISMYSSYNKDLIPFNYSL